MGFVHMYSKKIQPCYVNLIFVLFVATHTNYQTEEQYFRGGAAATEANQWRGSALLYTVTNQNRRGSGKPPCQLCTITALSCPKIQKLSVHLFFLYPFHIQSFLSLSFSVISTSIEISHTHSLQFLYISYPLFSLSYPFFSFICPFSLSNIWVKELLIELKVFVLLLQGDCRTYSYVVGISSDSEPNWENLMILAKLIPRICHNINR